MDEKTDPLAFLKSKANNLNEYAVKSDTPNIFTKGRRQLTADAIQANRQFFNKFYGSLDDLNWHEWTP